jgi:hypothetical protein
VEDKGGGEAGNKISIFFESSIYITTVSQFFLKTDGWFKDLSGPAQTQVACQKPRHNKLRGGGSQAGRMACAEVNCLCG